MESDEVDRYAIDSRNRAYVLGILAAFPSSRLVATSSLKNRSNSATVIGSFSTPIFANRSCTDGNTSAFTTSSCSLSTMARLGSTLRYRKDRSHRPGVRLRSAWHVDGEPVT